LTRTGIDDLQGDGSRRAPTVTTERLSPLEDDCPPIPVKLFVALVVGSVVAAVVLVGVLMMNPDLGQDDFAVFWWGMTVIVMVICIAFISAGIADVAEEQGPPGAVR
jgi:hypothetical protein